ncbi:NAD(P)/FAD-dependent oxidoreductase [Conexibacter sp. SYSU D00693]|uniref:NAD(P)/FAD-dependent oxidoreductase n=1 Tax=Conexibacter sp. SYSU D00693 TaxID=2812560 RepID=UPI00196A53B8|nr:NAD(P)/FAD-dependent oxidoreductase [Conexibacter sp. SYSU D00693]
MRVVVIGAGVAGAAAARALRAAGADVVVLEASDGVGGRTRTIERDGFRIDTGAIFLMGSYARTHSVLRELGRDGELHRWEARTAVLDDRGRRHPVRLDRPWTLLGMPQLSVADRLRLARGIGALAARRGPAPFAIDDLAAADDGRTLAAWARAAFGDQGFEYVVRPLMDPLTGADPEAISAAFTIALMHQVTRTQLTVTPGGMDGVARWLLDGVDVRLEEPALALEHDIGSVTVQTPSGAIGADAAVVATDVRTAARLLDGAVDERVPAALDAVVPVVAHHVLLGFRRDPWPRVPYDLVVRAGRGMHHDYGVLLNSRRAPGSCPPGGQSVSVYLDAAQTGGLDEDRAVRRAREALAQAFGDVEPDLVRAFPMDVALIAPTPGHYRRMLEARDRMPSRIQLAGDFLTHSGIEGALLSGEHAAAALLRRRTAATVAA